MLSEVFKDAQMTFADELRNLLNKHSQENASNTPDTVLAGYLLSCLAAWNVGVQQRETWHGRDASPLSPHATL